MAAERSHVKTELLAATGSADPYSILGVGSEATAEEIKKAYRTLALQHHPDKGGDPNKFRAVSIAHSILSDPEKRAVFDQTGDVDESGEELDEASFEQWYEYYRQLFPPITTSMIDSFADKYKGSEEEKNDALAAYKKYNGDMARVMDTVMLAETAQDFDRLEAFIAEAISRGELAATSKWQARKKPSAGGGKRGARASGSKNEPDGQDLMDEDEDDDDEEDDEEGDDDEDDEEEEEAGSGKRQSSKPAAAKGKAAKPAAKASSAKPQKPQPKAKPPPKAKPQSKKAGGGGASLEALILNRRGGGGGGSVFDKLTAKYGGKGKGGAAEPDIDDEEFERIRAGLDAKRR